MTTQKTNQITLEAAREVLPHLLDYAKRKNLSAEQLMQVVGYCYVALQRTKLEKPHLIKEVNELCQPSKSK